MVWPVVCLLRRGGAAGCGIGILANEEAKAIGWKPMPLF
jgi:hypothetical protein